MSTEPNMDDATIDRLADDADSFDAAHPYQDFAAAPRERATPQRCGKCGITPHRLFGVIWRCSECGGVTHINAADFGKRPELLDVPLGESSVSAPREKPPMRQVTIFVGATDSIDVSAYYRARGFAQLPTYPTMTGAEIRAAIPGLDPSDELWQVTPPGEPDRCIAYHEAVGLDDGMRFILVPMATYGMPVR